MKNKKANKTDHAESKKVAVSKEKKVALHFMETLTEVARESFLILDSDLKVISANPIFYKTFDVKKGDTERNLLFDLGNGQWNIPELKKLLKKVLPEKKDVKNFEVSHTFKKIGEKTMLLNASQVDSVQLIIIALEDISERKELTKKIQELETLNKVMVGRELKMVELKKEIGELKKK